MNYLISACTDVGIRKKTNQDSYSVKVAKTPKGTVTLSIICDGMGGLEKGEVASAHLVKKFSDWFVNDMPNILANESYENIKYQWNNIVQMENETISAYGKQSNATMGTTLTVGLFVENRLYAMHVGDTRLYKITDETIEILTEDQTLVAREIKRGNLTPEQAEVDPRRSVLLQCVGASRIVEPQYFETEVLPCTTYMMCSDGFRHKISADEIKNCFSPSKLIDKGQMTLVSKKMIELNKSRNETDNITVLLIKTF